MEAAPLIIGIDPGYRAGGVAIISGAGIWHSGGIVQTDKSLDPVKRPDCVKDIAQAYLAKIDGLVEGKPILMTAVEGTGYQGMKSNSPVAVATTRFVYYLTGLLSGALLCPVYQVNPNDWRKEIIGNARADSATIEAFTKMFHLVPEIIFEGFSKEKMSHLLDAFYVAQHARNHHNWAEKISKS